MERGHIYAWNTVDVAPTFVYSTARKCFPLPNLRANFHGGVPPVEHLIRDKHFFYKHIDSKIHNYPSIFLFKMFLFDTWLLHLKI